MFRTYKVYFKGNLVGTVNALSESSAKDKAAVLVEHVTGICRSASKYTGLATREIRVEAA